MFSMVLWAVVLAELSMVVFFLPSVLRVCWVTALGVVHSLHHLHVLCYLLLFSRNLTAVTNTMH